MGYKRVGYENSGLGSEREEDDRAVFGVEVFEEGFETEEGFSGEEDGGDHGGA